MFHFQKYASNTSLLTSVFVLLLGCFLIISNLSSPIGDFGNYYYGSKLFIDGRFTIDCYNDIHFFNEQIKPYGEINFFENYTPIPPFTLLFYTPLTFFSSHTAKLIFNFFSLFLFSISLYRWLKHLNIQTQWLLLLPIVLFSALKSNIVQGQTYLLLFVCLIEGFLAIEKGRNMTGTFLIAMSVLLKLFPVIGLVCFLFTKNYRALTYSLLWFILLTIITIVFLGISLHLNYYFDIAPRLFNNEINDVYYYGYQSLLVLLKKLFLYDALSNPHVIYNSRVVVIIISSLFSAGLLSLLYVSCKKKQTSLAFSFALFLIVLISGYGTNYGLVLIIPLYLYALKKHRSFVIYSTIIVFLIINIPVSLFSHLPIGLQFPRLYLLLLFLMSSIYYFSFKLNWKIAGAVFFILCLPKLYSRQETTSTYYQHQASSGILYDYSIHDDQLFMYICSGSKDTIETYPIRSIIHIKNNSSLTIYRNQIYLENNPLTTSTSHKKNPQFLNDSTILYLSDDNRGVRFYALRIMTLN